MVEHFNGMKIMKKYFYLAAVLPMLLLASCEKEATVNTLNATATIAGDNDTKTTYTDNGEDTQSALRVSWSDAESFKAYYSSTEYVTFSKTSGNTFTAADVPAGVTSATQFTGVYGTKAAYNSDGTVSIDFSGQDGSLENLSKYDVMTCISTTEAGALKFAFEHKCAIIRVKLTSTNAASANQNHLCIKFVNAKIKNGVSNGSSNSSNVIAGSSNAGGISSTGEGLKLDVYFSGPITSGQTKTIYVAVPPMEYNGINSSYVGGYFVGYPYGVELKSGKTIDAGKLYDIATKYQNGYATGIPD